MFFKYFFVSGDMSKFVVSLVSLFFSFDNNFYLLANIWTQSILTYKEVYLLFKIWVPLST